MRVGSMVLLGAMAVSPAASAKELGVHGGKAATLRVRGVAEKAIKLPAGVGGWYLTLDVPGDGASCNAELRDVSPLPGPIVKWVEKVPNLGESSTITLDPQRYLGTHTYQLQLRCGLRQLTRSMVHLLAPVDEATQVRFDLAQKAQPGEDSSAEPILTVPKSSL